MEALASFLVEKLAQRKDEFAPGIPRTKRMGAIPRVPRHSKKPVNWWFVDHKHEAKRSGLHSDLRLSDGNKAYSWAIKKGLPMTPGEKRTAIRQPDHSVSYISFQGHLPPGYGETKGRGVWIQDQGPARILGSSPSKINFTLLHKKNPVKFTLIRQGRTKWLLANTTPTAQTRPKVPQSKPKYREDAPEAIGRYLSNGRPMAVAAKIDGAHVTINLDRDAPEVYSHRPSERDTGLIDHTIISGLERVRVPKGVRGARVRSEIFFEDEKGKAIPNRHVTGILNASPQKGQDMLAARRLKIRHALLDVVDGPGGKDMSDAPYAEKLKILRKIKKSMGRHGFVLPDMAFTEAEQKKLVAKIKAGKHPQTREGMVAWRMDQAGSPTKLVIRPHQQVYVHTVDEGTGRFKGKAVRYSYSIRPGGPPVGFVGTGFNDELRSWMWKNRSKLKGKKAVIKSKEVFPSGALRAPSHSHFHM